ncbi:hypothetical protein OKW21_000595 [Catalinimonas alkaloidigena]|uniref:hypothetical protein n=1 Tax=Catalinimonas alkaloidigena TaxID=1075417 RepID=UPI0024056DEE|nr:hypothetical protein [Catalinimonas alkaloidigena]MDF9795332.1 hypothetical protein [Catalinimonas alkaloidigena]
MIDQYDFQQLGSLNRSSDYDPRVRNYDPYAPKSYVTNEQGVIIRDSVRSNSGNTYSVQQAREARIANRAHNTPNIADASSMTAGFGDIPKPLIIGGALLGGVVLIRSLVLKKENVKRLK